MPSENTNVSRFRDLYKANVHYFIGIGANELNPKNGNLIDGAFGLGGREILKRAFVKLTEDYNLLTTQQRHDFKLDIVGFSRSSALALAFSNMIWDGNGIPVGDHFEKVFIRFMGLFDTVASFNVGVLNFAGSPIAPLNLGWSLDRQLSTRYVAHAYRDPDFRPSFQTINVDADAKMAYSLSHWGVGTSNDSIKWMLQRAQSQHVPVARFFR